MPMNGWFWTTDPESEALIAQMGGAEQWEAVGVCCKILSQHEPDSIPLTRYRFHAGTGEISHFWTVDWLSEQINDVPGWIEEGIIGFLFAAETQGTVPLHRFAGPGGLKYWSCDENDSQGLGHESIIGWVYPSASHRENIVDLIMFERQRWPHCVTYKVGELTQFQTAFLPKNLGLEEVANIFIPWIAAQENKAVTEYEVLNVQEGAC